MTERIALGNYIAEYSVRNKSDEEIPVYSVTNSRGFCQEYFSKEVASQDKTTYKIVPRGCFAYNPSRINVGSVDWQRDTLNENALQKCWTLQMYGEKARILPMPEKCGIFWSR